MLLLLMDKDFPLYLSTKTGFSNRTINQMDYRFKRFSNWLKDNGLPLDKSSCEKYIQSLKDRGYAAASINLEIDMFVNMDKFFIDHDLPMRLSGGFKRFKIETKHIEILSIKEIEKITTTHIKYKRNNALYRRTEEVYLALTNFLAYTGCRFGEAQELKVADLDPSTGRVLIRKSKNGTYRYVYLPSFIVKRISFLLNAPPDTYVFRTFRNEKIMDSNFIPNLRKRALLAGVNKRCHPHLFRHSMATQLIVDGVPIESVATILGHKDISTTFDTYVHLADETIKRNMYRHSLFKQNTPPSEIIQALLESVKSYKLETDKRFNTKLIQNSNRLKIDITF